jgi:hypothetical protein
MSTMVAREGLKIKYRWMLLSLGLRLSLSARYLSHRLLRPLLPPTTLSPRVRGHRPLPRAPALRVTPALPAPRAIQPSTTPRTRQRTPVSTSLIARYIAPAPILAHLIIA